MKRLFIIVNKKKKLFMLGKILSLLLNITLVKSMLYT